MSGTVTKYFRTVTFNFSGKGTIFSGVFKIEVDNTGVPILNNEEYNFENISGDNIDVLLYFNEIDKLSIESTTIPSVGHFNSFASATENTTYTSSGGTWSYTLEVVPPEPVFGFNLDGMIDTDYMKEF